MVLLDLNQMQSKLRYLVNFEKRLSEQKNDIEEQLEDDIED